MPAQPTYQQCCLHPYSWVPAGGYPWAFYHQYAYQQYINYHKSFHLNAQSSLQKSPSDAHKALLQEAIAGSQLEFVAVGGQDAASCAAAQAAPPTLIPDLDRATSVSPTNDSQADECFAVAVPTEASIEPRSDGGALLPASDDGFPLDETLGWPEGVGPDVDLLASAVCES